MMNAIVANLRRYRFCLGLAMLSLPCCAGAQGKAPAQVVKPPIATAYIDHATVANDFGGDGPAAKVPAGGALEALSGGLGGLLRGATGGQGGQEAVRGLFGR